MTKELTGNPNQIITLPRKKGSKELDPQQGTLDLGVERQAEVDGIGMGVLSDGTSFLTGRGLARLVGLENLHIRTIGQEWNDDPAKPRISAIKSILASRGITSDRAFVEVMDKGRVVHAFPDVICLAVLEYYAFDAPREAARQNYRVLAGKALRDFIYSQVGYDPSGADRFKDWHDRIALNYQSAPSGYFHVFNEAHTLIYELILAGAPIGPKFVVDISIGQHWGKFWADQNMEEDHAARRKYPHSYPDTHPQSRSNPQESWCYPLSALGAYRQWLEQHYIQGGKFAGYLQGKVTKRELPPSVAQLALDTLVRPQLQAS